MCPSSDTGVQKLCQLQSHSWPVRSYVVWKVTECDEFVHGKLLEQRLKTSSLTAMIFYMLGTGFHKNPVVGLYIKYLRLIHMENECKINIFWNVDLYLFWEKLYLFLLFLFPPHWPQSLRSAIDRGHSLSGDKMHFANLRPQIASPQGQTRWRDFEL
jgi:hypothetical protein